MGAKPSKPAVVPQPPYRPCVIDVEIKTCSTRTEKTADGGDNPDPESKAASTTILLLFSHNIYADMYYYDLRKAGALSASAVRFVYDGKKDVKIAVDSTVPFFPTKFTERVITFATEEDARQWETLTKLWTSDPTLASNERRIPSTLGYYEFSDRFSVPEQYDGHIFASETSVGELDVTFTNMRSKLLSRLDNEGHLHGL
ncbi:hypothetical protein C8A03DRAFT_34898 [Achaetomium macrosporum]|uniref:Uncharacterized protein n=1 Tax=Achaetomium macrosporum TaxID=79813 RepID=A0AAN7H6D3_9PEZI|nr:hypothetical protein C8A03DRAFT_34898 [Achaetomium macrosporum]